MSAPSDGSILLSPPVRPGRPWPAALSFRLTALIRHVCAAKGYMEGLALHRD